MFAINSANEVIGWYSTPIFQPAGALTLILYLRECHMRLRHIARVGEVESERRLARAHVDLHAQHGAQSGD